jgi:hypothetical protein
MNVARRNPHPKRPPTTRCPRRVCAGRRGTALLPWLFVLALLLRGAPAGWAQPTQPEAGGDPLDNTAFTAGLNGVKIGDDWFLRLTLGGVLRVRDVQFARAGSLFDQPVRGDLRLLFHLPLSYMVHDGGAPTESRWRREDWDEPSEYLRLARIVEYGRPYGPMYLRAGELSNVRIGHRTVVDNYINTLDVDRFRWGIHHNLNTVYGGYEVLLDNVTAPRLLGMRTYVRPAALANRDSWWRRFAVGASLFGDVQAPAVLAQNADGTYALNSLGQFVVDEGQATGIVGLDVELAVVDTEVVSVTPYSDANVHLAQGAGWHLGSFLAVQPSERVVLDARTEFRLLGAGYLPTYFGPLYEVERFAFRAPGQSPTLLPKLQWLRTGQEDERRVGWFGELGLNVGQLVRVAGAVENYQGPDSTNAWFSVSVPAYRYFQFAAYYANTRFQGVRQMFRAENALAMAEARIMLTDGIYFNAQVNRRWKLDPDGRYAPVDDFAVGFSAAFGF